MITTYLVSRYHFSVTEFKTLEEKWSGKLLDLSHLRMFSYAAYAHQSEGKLEPRALRCLFLRYP